MKKTPTRRAGPLPESARQSESAIADFAAKLRATPPPEAARGRLLFALDATMSRQPTWDRASAVQAEMFREAAAAGGLAVQLVYFRGLGECRASRWVTNGEALARLMGTVACHGGLTQITRVLRHAEKETKAKPLSAMVYIGDACEEPVDEICAAAGALALQNVRIFAFHEGHDPAAGTALREMARLTGGAYCPFDSGAPGQLRDLLRAVAVYAAGGHRALADYSRRGGQAALKLIGQMR